MKNDKNSFAYQENRLINYQKGFVKDLKIY